MITKNLNFFDKNGYNLNFEYDEALGYWNGSIYMPKVSVGIHASESIYILENVGGEYVFPMSSRTNDAIYFRWDSSNKFVDEFFMFNFDDTYILKETSALIYTPNDGPECETILVNRFDEYEIKLKSEQVNVVLPVHVAFVASEKYDATTYERTLFMYNNDRIIAKIRFFCETVEEDERLKIWNSNLGYNITDDDSIIFYKSDIKECKPDYKILNEKRKELMLEGSNIYPYIGSYKAIINAIKFFGYDNLGIIEYWKNVNTSDENFGKIYHSTRYSLTKKETISVGARIIKLPNKDYKKINKIALVYSINTPTGEVDEFELPLMKQEFEYTIEEALIKLFALRNKLNKEFMPGSSRIIDIIGEGNYFGIQGVEKIGEDHALTEIDRHISIGFDVEPDTHVYLKKKGNEYLATVNLISPKVFGNDFDDENISFAFFGESEPQLNQNSTTFENIDFLNNKRKWILEMSANQYDEDLGNIGVVKEYVKKPLNENIINSETETTAVNLKYIGYYDVTLNILSPNNDTLATRTKRKFIKVEQANPEIRGFFYDARNLPQEIAYSIPSDSEAYSTITSELTNALDGAIAERDSDTELDMTIKNNGPYINGNITTSWYVLDHISFELSTLDPYLKYARYIHNGVDVKPFTWFLLTFDDDVIPYDKQTHKPLWTLENEFTGESVSFEGKYFTCLIKKEGNYKISLSFDDINGNHYDTSRNILVVKKSARYEIYQTFRKENEEMFTDEEGFIPDFTYVERSGSTNPQTP